MAPTLLKTFRWTLRILSGIFIAFFLMMFIGETFFEPEAANNQPLSANSIVQLSLFGFVLIGLALAWRRELYGGLLALIAYFALTIVNPNTLKPSLLYIYPITGLLFIILWFLNRTIAAQQK